MAKILIGVPSSRYYQPFLESLPRFIEEISKEHTVSVCFVKDRKVDEARNEIVDFFLNTDFEYILFLDDDHSGHTKEMLDILLKQNTYFASILCYTRYFPYAGNLLFYSGYADPNIKYADHSYTEGSRECDLAGFGMGLIRRDTFSKIDKPYFVADNNSHEDNYFCDKLIANGIHPVGVWDYVLTHNGIGKENVTEEYKKSILTHYKNNLHKAKLGRHFNQTTQREELVMHF